MLIVGIEIGWFVGCGTRAFAVWLWSLRREFPDAMDFRAISF